MEIEVLDHAGLRYYTNKYISTMNNDISKVEGDLVVTKDISERRGDIKMEIEVLDHAGLRYYTNKYISTMNNDISKVEGDLVVTNQTVREIQTQLDDINSLVSKEVSSEISSIVSDIAKVTFQLDLKDMVNTSEMTHVKHS